MSTATASLASFYEPNPFRLTCTACGASRPARWPVPKSWDFHLVDGRTEISCSAECREYGGYAEYDEHAGGTLESRP